MNKNLKQIIVERRISQEKFAEIINVSRPTAVKVLTGKRELKLSEATALAKTFDITLDEFFTEKKLVDIILEKKADEPKKEQVERIIIPAAKVDKFKNILLYITQKIGALPNVGQTVLYKILYFCDFDYFEKYEEQLVGAHYIRNHYGPTPKEFRAIIEEMIEDGQIEEVKTKYFDKDQTKYIPVKNPDLSVLNGRELKHLDEEIERLGDKTAKELSDFSHKDVPWIITPEGTEIDYESVFYRTPETSVRSYDSD